MTRPKFSPEVEKFRGQMAKMPAAAKAEFGAMLAAANELARLEEHGTLDPLTEASIAARIERAGQSMTRHLGG